MFSQKVRERDSFRCFTCDAILDKYTSQAGHFKHNRLDFDEINVNCQCVKCNKWKHGNLGEYAIRLIKKYGIEVVDDLTLRANQHIGYTLEELEVIYDKLKEEQC